MASKNQEKATVKSELERLREILFGEYEQSTDSRIDNLEAKLAQFSREILQSLSGQGDEQSRQIETTRQSLEDKLEQIGADIRQEIAGVRRDMDAQVAALRHDLAEKQVLGRLLIDLGTQIQNEDEKTVETES